MKHYGISQWVDFARGLMLEPDGSQMRRHLDEGCAECRGVARFWADLHVACNRMDSHPVPEWVLRSARSIFPVKAPERARPKFRIPVELLFDSFLVPAPAGFRATWQIGWQALYRAGDCSLDLRIEPELNSCRAAVVGQISNHTLPEFRMEGIPVYLKSGRVVVAETRSNQFGEFQMEYEQQGRLQLYVSLDDGSKCFQVPLKRFASERPVRSERDRPPASGQPRLEQ